jgi:molybdopterin converting factor small subunit
MGLVTIEFYGMPRKLAERAELAVSAGTVDEALAAVERACPRLTGVVRTRGRLFPHFLLSINGQSFVSDSTQELQPGDRLLLLSADAGG